MNAHRLRALGFVQLALKTGCQSDNSCWPHHAFTENRFMEFAIWTYAAAIGWTSLAVSSLGGMFGNIYHQWLGGKPLPSDRHTWIGYDVEARNMITVHRSF
jgi:hypothetical protein